MARCLIVDDSKFMRRIIRQALEEGGHTIIDEADNGADGVKAYKFSKPDLVTMDITMGGKDGIIAVKEIIDFDPQARVIVVSALNENTIKMHEKNIKAVAFLTKPFDKDDLLNIIKKIL
ncbi:MAG TPA: response regulator [Spirochaetota bacterium]|nr:response regulator [Spirochaetota bacterium]HPI90214.1 response regulator [Spirochaetota bacterium]HPR46534.1 response regulator [Spirochaetota bacterium]